MAKIDYEKLACDALGLKHPSDLKQGEVYHNIGTFQIGASEEAVRQITEKRRAVMLETIEKVARELWQELGDDFPDNFANEQWAKIGFLSLSQYRDSVRHIRSLRKDYENQSAHIQDLLEIYDPDAHTDDAEGYKNYLSWAAGGTRKLLDLEVPALIPEHSRKMHSYVIGRIGYGKTTLLKTLIHSYVKQDNSGIVILDPHGDFAYEVARWKEFADSDKLVLIDPNLSPDKIPRINPIQLPKGVSPDVFSQELTLIFEDMLAGDNNAFSPNMKTILQNTLRILIEKDGTNLFNLSEFLTDGTDGVWLSSGKKHRRKTVSHFFNSQFKEPQFKMSKNAVAGKVSSILDADAAQDLFLGASTFNLEELLDQRKVIIFNLAIGSIGEAASEALGRFILGRMYGIAMRRQREALTDRTPIHVFVDECHTFVGERLSKTLAETRKYGVHLTLANQFRRQIRRMSVQEAMVKIPDIKLVGLSSEDPYLAREMELTPDRFRALKRGEFIYKAGSTQAVKINVRSDLADKNNDMDAQSWAELIERQLERYYVPLHEEETATKDDTPDHGEIV